MVALEKHLLERLDAHDDVTGEDGVLLFNVNQVAYIVEETNTQENKQRTTRRHLEDANPPLKTIMRKCPKSYQGESFI